MHPILSWAALCAAAEIMLTLAQLPLRNKAKKGLLRALLILVKAQLAVAFAYLVMAGPVMLRPVQPLLVALYAVLLPDAAADLVCSLVCALRKKERRFGAYKLLGLALTLLFVVYGTVNMQRVSPVYHSYASAKLSEPYTLVFVSDLHVGSAQPFSVTEKTVEAIRDAQPDAVILGGDLTDDYTTKAEMRETYRLFGSLGVPVYYIDGNHEVVQHPEYLKNGLPYTEEELLAALEENGITVLQDTYAALTDEIMLLGREDAASPGRAMPEETPGADKLLVAADHQPVTGENLALGAELQLSGHTHAGQLFPLRRLYAFFVPAWGEYDLGEGRLLIVSAGVSGWRVPFRTEARCGFEVVRLVPAA